MEPVEPSTATPTMRPWYERACDGRPLGRVFPEGCLVVLRQRQRECASRDECSRAGGNNAGWAERRGCSRGRAVDGGDGSDAWQREWHQREPRVAAVADRSDRRRYPG